MNPVRRNAHQAGDPGGDADERTPRGAPIAGAVYGQVLATGTVAALTRDESVGAGGDMIALIGTVGRSWPATLAVALLNAALGLGVVGLLALVH